MEPRPEDGEEDFQVSRDQGNWDNFFHLGRTLLTSLPFQRLSSHPLFGPPHHSLCLWPDCGVRCQLGSGHAVVDLL